MHIHHLALRVRDFEKSLHFYQTLTELKIHTQFSANGGSIAYLQNASGETQLELIGMPEGETVKASGMFLCFGTEDIASAHERAVLHGISVSRSRMRAISTFTIRTACPCRCVNTAKTDF